ncbi:adenylosuccinate synthetase [Candidatus Woesebacteria bacterium]|nr:adenylosuccinate synthetase [Candidatus Woesebacteria bacterium]
MNNFKNIYEEVYKNGKLFGISKANKNNPLLNNSKRKNSIAIMGGILGDEGKGRIADQLTSDLLKKHKKVFHYRDNGGANAGHTVEVGELKIALHQLGAGVLQKGCVAILGKEMVLHPEDLVAEILEVKKVIGKSNLPSELIIDEAAFLCLDTHRAYENVLKMRSTGSKASTGRGISPAYVDVILRNPLRIRDLIDKNWKEKFEEHYKLYQTIISGFGLKLSSVEVPRLSGKNIKVGSFAKMISRLEESRKVIKPLVASGYEIIKEAWSSKYPVVFEKAQAIGLDKRWGVYPDITASDCTFDGIFSSTEGLVDPQDIAVKVAVLKATYSSSVGTRNLPTMMKGKLASKIREDANEYGATTKRPRDIAYIDLPMISYLFKVGKVEYLTMTHLDIAYPNTPIKVCIDYKIGTKSVGYRPDQEYLNKVEPVYVDLPSWDGSLTQETKSIKDLPKEALQYLAFISKSLETKLFMVTTGPKREQTINWW